MNFKILYIFLILLVIIVLFSLLVAREVSIIQPKFQGNNTQETASQEEHKEFLPYDFSSPSPVDKRFSITVIKRLPKEESLPKEKKEIKEILQPEQSTVPSNQNPVVLEGDSNQPDSEDGAGKGLFPTEDERKEMNRRGIMMF